MGRFEYYYKLNNGRILHVQNLRSFILKTFPWSRAAYLLSKCDCWAHKFSGSPSPKIGAWDAARFGGLAGRFGRKALL